MKIGIIGAGLIGGTLARKFALAGQEVQLANSKSPDTLAGLGDGITAMWAADAVDGVDVAILSIPQHRVAALSDNVVRAVSSVPIVLDTGNYYPVRDGHITPLDDGMADSEWVASQLGRPVFKVFNNIGAPSLKHNGHRAAEVRLGLTIAGPASDDKQTVLALVEQLGFDPVDAGELAESWRVQPGTPTYCQNMSAAQLRDGLAKTVQADIPTYHRNRDRLQDFAAAAKRQSEIM